MLFSAIIALENRHILRRTRKVDKLEESKPHEGIVRGRRKTIPQREGRIGPNSERPILNHSCPSPGNKEDRRSRLFKERRGRRGVAEKVSGLVLTCSDTQNVQW